MGNVISSGPIPPLSPSAPDVVISPVGAPVPAAAVKIGTIAITVNNIKYFYICFAYHTNMTVTPTVVAAPLPPALGGAPMGPSMPKLGAIKHIVMGQLLKRMQDINGNNGPFMNSFGPDTPSQCTAWSLSP